MDAHPLSELIPSMTEGEYAELRQDIEVHGLQVPITLYKGKVLDGRHRAKACAELGFEPETREYEGGQPAAYVISLNVRRRNLVPAQLAAVAVDFLPALEEEARRNSLANLKKGDKLPSESPDSVGSPARKESRSYQQAGERVGTSEAQVGRAKRIKRDDPEEFERLRRGETTVGAAHRKVTKAKATPPPPPVAEPQSLTKRQRQLADAAKLRVEKTIGTCNGLARGLADLKIESALRVSSAEEVKGWDGAIRDALAALKQLRKRINQ